MKKTILISLAIITTLSLVAFTFINEKDKTIDNPETASIEVSTEKKLEKIEGKTTRFDDFIYEIGPRFSPIKKADLINATSINSIFNENKINDIESINSIKFIKVENDKRTDKSEIGNGASFTDNQINFLKSLDYSTSFVMEMDYRLKSDLIERISTPHYTIIPETQAQYIYGKDALIKYFKEHTKYATANIPEDKLKPAKLYFNVTKDGTVNNVRLDRSSGYPNIDELMIGLITKTPGGWIPALNSEGETVDQELVVSFGLMGC